MEPIWTESDVEALKDAIRRGVKSVSYAGPPARTVVYHDLGEMRSLLAEMVGQVRGATRYRNIVVNRGFDE